MPTRPLTAQELADRLSPAERKVLAQTPRVVEPVSDVRGPRRRYPRGHGPTAQARRRAEMKAILATAPDLAVYPLHILQRRCRIPAVVDLRCRVVRLLRAHGHTSPEIGRLLACDHATVLNLQRRTPTHPLPDPVVLDLLTSRP